VFVSHIGNECVFIRIDNQVVIDCVFFVEPKLFVVIFVARAGRKDLRDECRQFCDVLLRRFYQTTMTSGITTMSLETISVNFLQNFRFAPFASIAASRDRASRSEHR